MNYTEYMNLRKPEEDDFYSVEDISENAEKIDKKIKEVDEQLENKVEKKKGKDLSENDYTTKEKTKLSEIEEGANKYIHPEYPAKNERAMYKMTVDAMGHVTNATKVTKSDITNLGIPGENTTYSNFAGATAEDNGKQGLVPAPYTNGQNHFLQGNGEWTPLEVRYKETERELSIQWNNGSTKVTIPEASEEMPGVMPKGIYKKIKTIKTIEGVEIEDDVNVSHYCECNTYKAATEKKITLEGFRLVNGARITVCFKSGNIADNPTLNVNGTGAKPIFYRNRNIPAGMIRQYKVMELVYSGTYWYVVGDMDETILLTTADIVPTALSTWVYTSEIPELERYDEIRVWTEIGDGFRGWVTLTVDDPKDVAVTGYVSATYNGSIWLKWDIDGHKIGLYVRTENGWGMNTIKIGEIDGVRMS